MEELELNTGCSFRARPAPGTYACMHNGFEANIAMCDGDNILEPGGVVFDDENECWHQWSEDFMLVGLMDE